MIKSEDYKKLLDKIEENEKESNIYSKFNQNERLYYMHLKQCELLTTKISSKRIFDISEEVYWNVTAEIKKLDR